MNQNLEIWLNRSNRFRDAANKILGSHEHANRSRLIQLEQTYADLALLNIKQDDLFRQALRCADNGLFRAAHVMAWAACMDYVEEKLSEDGLIALRREYPNWTGGDIHEIAESVPERQLIETLRKVHLATKNEVSLLIGLLQRRNECAHPTQYLPGVNETLGYMSELIQRVKFLSSKTIS